MNPQEHTLSSIRTFVIPPNPGEAWTDQAAAGLVGQTFRYLIDDVMREIGTVLAAKVDSDGALRVDVGPAQ